MNKSKTIVILGVVIAVVVLIAVVALIAGSIFAYLYFSENDIGIGEIRQGTEYILETNEGALSETDFEDAISVLQARLDDLGYTKSEVERLGSDRIKVTVADEGLGDNAHIILGTQGRLTFQDYQYNTILDNSDVSDASVEKMTLADGTMTYAVTLKFTSAGAKKFEKETERISQLDDGNNYIGIYIDDDIISAPSVSEEIVGGECYISGDFTKEQAETLAARIESPALPFSLTIAETRTFNK